MSEPELAIPWINDHSDDPRERELRLAYPWASGPPHHRFFASTVRRFGDFPAA